MRASSRKYLLRSWKRFDCIHVRMLLWVLPALSLRGCSSQMLRIFHGHWSFSSSMHLCVSCKQDVHYLVPSYADHHCKTL